MRRPERLLGLLPLLLFACGGTDDASPSADAEPFAAFARDVFTELRSEPIDTTLRTEIGLFGDLSVGAGEEVVMDRYRYRLDSTEMGALARMAFEVQDTEGHHAPVPVQLTFVARDDAWHFERSAFGSDLVSSSADSAAGHSAHASQGEERSDEPPSDLRAAESPIHQILRARLHAWIDAALSRARA